MKRLFFGIAAIVAVLAITLTVGARAEVAKGTTIAKPTLDACYLNVTGTQTVGSCVTPIGGTVTQLDNCGEFQLDPCCFVLAPDNGCQTGDRKITKIYRWEN